MASGHPACRSVPMRWCLFVAILFAKLAKSKAACFPDAIPESALKDLPSFGYGLGVVEIFGSPKSIDDR